MSAAVKPRKTSLTDLSEEGVHPRWFRHGLEAIDPEVEGRVGRTLRWKSEGGKDARVV